MDILFEVLEIGVSDALVRDLGGNSYNIGPVGIFILGILATVPFNVSLRMNLVSCRCSHLDGIVRLEAAFYQMLLLLLFSLCRHRS